MRVEKKYTFMLAMSLLMVLLLLVTGLREPARMEAQRAFYTDYFVEKGAKLYAKNCTNCHGAGGQGHVGMPLNREDLRGHPDDNLATYDYLYKVIARGRSGTDIPRWERTEDGAWVSYTAMPAWHQDDLGPMDSEKIKALVYFIMLGDWRRPNAHMPQAAPDPTEVPDPTERRQRWFDGLLDAPSLTAEENAMAKELFVAKACVTCHANGAVGGVAGPDLSNVGSWGLDYDFLYNWIRDPLNAENRMPVYWKQHQDGPDLVLENPLAIPPTQMVPMPFEDDELDLLVRYLLGLK